MKPLILTLLLAGVCLGQNIKQTVVKPCTLVKETLEGQGWAILLSTPDVLEYDVTPTTDAKTKLHFSTEGHARIIFICFKNNADTGVPDTKKLVFKTSGPSPPPPGPDPVDPDNPDPNPGPRPTTLVEQIMWEGKKAKFDPQLAEEIGVNYETVASQLSAVPSMTVNQGHDMITEMNTRTTKGTGRFAPKAFKPYALQLSNKVKSTTNKQELIVLFEALAKGFKGI